MLIIENLHVSYGAIRALKGINCQINEGEIVALIGANGAGKSTTLNTISGMIKPKEGTVKYKGSPLNKLPPHKIVKLGISQVPEGRRIFTRMTVFENLELGAYTRKAGEAVKNDINQIFKRFPRLQERKSQLAGTLSGGEQQMLAIGRALMSKPQLLLLDEPSMGLAPILVKEIFDIIKEINALGTTILLVEQNAHMALSIAKRAYVLETGKVVLSGTAKDLANNPEVKKIYLGQ
ncbi:ABC transporter ATP-binding protein [Desulfolucanica intricata]|uniref:ABC transporter ATP-binding protein n=1 Tax=Desulfolucanica intricata TaxID=1285191 RepID=UPI00082BEF10|nr:ABC transporter ATP-binding protein [Desulfolucanica intricata]